MEIELWNVNPKTVDTGTHSIELIEQPHVLYSQEPRRDVGGGPRSIIQLSLGLDHGHLDSSLGKGESTQQTHRTGPDNENFRLKHFQSTSIYARSGSLITCPSGM